MSEAAWTPRPLAKVIPFRVRGWPSPAPNSPLLMSFSTGPYPLTADVQVQVLRNDVPDGWGATGVVVGVGVALPQVNLASAQSAWSWLPPSPPSVTTSWSWALPATLTLTLFVAELPF